MVVKVIIHPVCLNLGIHFTSCYHSLGFVGANFRAEVSTGKNPSKKKTQHQASHGYRLWRGATWTAGTK
jgi:hypothetical protein